MYAQILILALFLNLSLVRVDAWVLQMFVKLYIGLIHLYTDLACFNIDMMDLMTLKINDYWRTFGIVSVLFNFALDATL